MGAIAPHPTRQAELTPPRALLSRRRLLGLSVGGAAAIALAWAVQLEDPAPELRVLGRRERALIDAVGEALFPPGNPVGPGWAELDLGAEVDRMLDHELGPSMVTPFRALLKGLDLAALWTFGGRFAACTLPERLELLRAWGEAGVVPTRLAHDSIKSIMGLAYFNHPRVLAQLGYRASCLELSQGRYAF